MPVAIEVENLSKQYRIGVRERDNFTLREALTNAMQTPFTRRQRHMHFSSEIVWALKELNFAVQQGESIGIIGRNGAGKSTLLKILSRITRPTGGRARVRGRLASMIEVGTGFHPDLSGRENIYLNGSLMGMKRSEIKRKFDEIVAFSEIEKFLDTAVKYYSTGMYMRLAFAVAAHLEPEILVLDEVLSVGDAGFQKKCLKKMRDVAEEGRTILFVSHGLTNLADLCSRAIWLDHGHKKAEGPVHEVIKTYLAQYKETENIQSERIWLDIDTAPGGDNVRLHAVRVLADGQTTSSVNVGDTVHIEVEYWTLKPQARVGVGIYLLNQAGVGILSSSNVLDEDLSANSTISEPQPPGLYRVACTLPGDLLNESCYRVHIYLATDQINAEGQVRDAVSFCVRDDSPLPQSRRVRLGVVRPHLIWQKTCLQEG